MYEQFWQALGVGTNYIQETDSIIAAGSSHRTRIIARSHRLC